MQQTEQPTTTIPPYIFRMPECPLCGESCGHDGDAVNCEECGVFWPDDGAAGVRYDREETDACGAETRPYANQDRHPGLVGFTYRCVLSEGHDGEHRGRRVDRDYADDTHSWK